MKKRTSLLIVLIFLLSAGAVFSLDNFGLRFLGEGSIDFTGMDFYDDQGEFSWDAMDVNGISPIYWGFTWSLAFDRFGFGSTSQVNFEGEDLTTVMEFDYSLYMTFHFFKTNRPVDWFVEAGVGCGGLLDFQAISQHSFSDYDTIDYLQLSIYPHLATGLAFKFGKKSPFTFGGRFVVKPAAWKIPVAPIQFHETSLFEASLFLGITLNFDRTESLEDEYNEDREEELRDKYEDLLEEKEDALEDLQDELEDLKDDMNIDDDDDDDDDDNAIIIDDEEEDKDDFELKIEEIKDDRLEGWRSDEAKELEKKAKESSITIENEKDTVRIDININTKD